MLCGLKAARARSRATDDASYGAARGAPPHARRRETGNPHALRPTPISRLNAASCQTEPV